MESSFVLPLNLRPSAAFQAGGGGPRGAESNSSAAAGARGGRSYILWRRAGWHPNSTPPSSRYTLVPRGTPNDRAVSPELFCSLHALATELAAHSWGYPSGLRADADGTTGDDANRVPADHPTTTHSRPSGKACAPLRHDVDAAV